jgi:hypothetical protein
MQAIFLTQLRYLASPAWERWARSHGYHYYSVITPDQDNPTVSGDRIVAPDGIPIIYQMELIERPSLPGRTIQVHSLPFTLPTREQLLSLSGEQLVNILVPRRELLFNPTYWASLAATVLCQPVNVNLVNTIIDYVDVVTLNTPLSGTGSWWLMTAVEKGLVTPATIRWGYHSTSLSIPEAGLYWDEKQYPRHWAALLLGLRGDYQLIQTVLGRPEDTHVPTIRSYPIIGVGAILGGHQNLFLQLEVELRSMPHLHTALMTNARQLAQSKATGYEVDGCRYELPVSRAPPSLPLIS